MTFRDFGRWLRPFTWLGVNPLAIYFLSELTGHFLDRAWVSSSTGSTTPRAWLFWQVLDPWLSHRFGSRGTSLVFAAGFTSIWIAVAGLFYRQRVRIRVRRANS